MINLVFLIPMKPWSNLNSTIILDLNNLDTIKGVVNVRLKYIIRPCKIIDFWLSSLQKKKFGFFIPANSKIAYFCPCHLSLFQKPWRGRRKSTSAMPCCFFPLFHLVHASYGSGLFPHLVLEDLSLPANPSVIDQNPFPNLAHQCQPHAFQTPRGCTTSTDPDQSSES